MAEKVVFAMPTYTRGRSATTLQLTIDTMFASAGYEHEVVVVNNDDGVVPGRKHMSVSLGNGGAEVICNGRNVGIPKSVNAVWREWADGKTYLGYCGDNFIGSEWWLGAYMDIFERNEDVGMVSAIVSNAFASSHLLSEKIDPSECSPWGPIEWVDSVRLPTKAILVRPEVVDRIGFFDERLPPVGCNDRDYKERVRADGWKVAVIISGIMLTRIGVNTSKYQSWKEKTTTAAVDVYTEIWDRRERGEEGLYVK